MSQMLTSNFIQKLSQSKQRFLLLLCLILGLLVIVPILNRFATARIFLDIFLTAVVISMVYAISHKKGYVIAGLSLAIVMLASVWLQYFYPNKSIAIIGMLTGVLFIAVVIANILGYMLKTDEIDREIIYAAILLYLMAALLWAFVYSFLELVDPASFNIDLDRPEGYLLVFQYYSFVTITTLGYGDITPVAVFVGALTLTITFRLAPLNESLKGFSNPGMLTVGALLMVAAGMYRTGAITLITEKLIGHPKSLLAAQAKILPPVAVGIAFLNNTPLVAMFIPVI